MNRKPPLETSSQVTMTSTPAHRMHAGAFMGMRLDLRRSSMAGSIAGESVAFGVGGLMSTPFASRHICDDLHFSQGRVRSRVASNISQSIPDRKNEDME